MYKLRDEDPTGIETRRSFYCFNVNNCVNTKIVHLLVNYYKLVIIIAQNE